MLNFNRLSDTAFEIHTGMAMPPRISLKYKKAISVDFKIGTEEIMLASGCTRLGNMPPSITDGSPMYMIEQTMIPTQKQKDMLGKLSEIDMSRYNGTEITYETYGEFYTYPDSDTFNKFFYGNVLNANYLVKF